MPKNDDDESFNDGDSEERDNSDEQSASSDHESGDGEAISDSKSAENRGQDSVTSAGGSEKLQFRPLSRTKTRRKKSYDVTGPEDLLPSFARKTNRGGYAHTNRTKSKISQANTGNTPWNKGVNRSSADRAKIAAGVRARNRAILLEKLKRLGLSEEDWHAKKKEIKYLRERIRRAKLSKKRLEQAEAERNLQAIIDATTEKVGRYTGAYRRRAHVILY
jgi:NUMOD3 motif